MSSFDKYKRGWVENGGEFFFRTLFSSHASVCSRRKTMYIVIVQYELVKRMKRWKDEIVEVLFDVGCHLSFVHHFQLWKPEVMINKNFKYPNANVLLKFWSKWTFLINVCVSTVISPQAFGRLVTLSNQRPMISIVPKAWKLYNLSPNSPQTYVF